jgi:hypothetical protein
MRAEYEEIRGLPYEPPVLNWLFFGNFKFKPALIEMGLTRTAKAILTEHAKNRKKESAKNPVPDESAASQTDLTKISPSLGKNLIPQKNLRRLKRRLAKIKLVKIIWNRIIAIRRRIRKHNA